MEINNFFNLQGQENIKVEQDKSNIFKSLIYGDQVNIGGEPYIVIGHAGGISTKPGTFSSCSLTPKHEFINERESDYMIGFYTQNAEQSKLGSERLTGRSFKLSDFVNIN
ncbi:hypothetical protein COV12_00100 [Candidatus Woesearchaeota archaeon CG10_big_fil_rev_8_21_14_0_10_32_24]|nr:MAG: hypothetical protein COV12_00100 [Candidatus Woesearchaeota archaeon CG10_big_fil_rev_8_21_14_0_10_32_24]